MSKKVTRLYQSFRPESYNLKLKLNSEKDKFSGIVRIAGRKVGRPSKRLTFHQKDLKISKVSVYQLNKSGQTEVEVVRINKQDSFNELRIHTKEMVYPGSYILIIEYSGLITKPMNGIYPSFFKENGKDKKILTTQFESHHAREAFVCIDEPEAKATFDLILDTEKVKTVISNTELVSQKSVDKRLISEFAKTPKMSTYLLAFVVGDLEYIEGKTKDNVIVRTYATKNNVAHTKFALDCAVKNLEFYNQYFNIPYPLTKCDLVALPDFASGAMENWGCITFREQALIVDPTHTSLSLKQYVANVVAHELTHQWFGNLVTMRWWTDLWLNESFASWMSYLAVDNLFPDWKVWTQFIVDEQSPALKFDALENTHPIEVDIKHPDEIRTIFDIISYEKGASVLTMLEDYLGADVFKAGVQYYLNKHQYSNTNTVDLWQALEEVSKKPVKDFMSVWTKNSGFPILSVNYSADKLSLGQSRFQINPAANLSNHVWPIPLLSSGDNDHRGMLTKISSEYTINSNQPISLFNVGRRGFYRIIYDPQTLDTIVKSGVDKLSDLDRLGLLSDTVEAAKAGHISTLQTLKLLESYRQESSTVVWDIIAEALSSIKLVMNDDQLRELIKPYISEFSQIQFKRLGWNESEKDSHFDRLLRPIVISLAAGADTMHVVNQCLELFAQLNDKLNPIPPDLRSVVYVCAARWGDQKTFDKLLKRHNSSSSAEERLNLTSALTAFKQPEIIEQSLKLIKSDEVRLQDVSFWISGIFVNHYSRAKAWHWLKENWSWLANNIGEDLSFSRMPLYVGRCYSDLDFLKEFEAFFDLHLSPAFERPLKQAIETIQWQAAWKNRDLDDIKGYLEEHYMA
jgi:aminopeptidase N